MIPIVTFRYLVAFEKRARKRKTFVMQEARETNEEKARRWKLQCKQLRHRLAAAKNHLMQSSIVQVSVSLQSKIVDVAAGDPVRMS